MKIKVTPEFSDILSDFIVFSLESGLSERTMEGKSIQLTRFLNYIRESDIRNTKPAVTVKLIGKGSKTRIIPLMPQTLDILNRYMDDCKRKNIIPNN